MKNGFTSNATRAIKNNALLYYDHNYNWFFVTEYIHIHPKHELIKDFRLKTLFNKAIYDKIS